MALSVRLAGYNVDADLLKDVIDLLQTLEREISLPVSATPDIASLQSLRDAISEKMRRGIAIEAFTPETISAAYARISRDPQHVGELRKAARHGVARARKSNENIIFGLGHASVAEHACFNLDVSGLSRLAAEELQSHRLISFTEKSQRYISVTADYVVPSEIRGSAWESRFAETAQEMFESYDRLSRELAGRQLRGLAQPTKEEQRDAELRAKEDARYLLPLACATQMGMTLNARNAEHVVCALADHPLQEVRDLSRAIAHAVGPLAPSLVKYTTRGPFPRANRKRLRQLMKTDEARISEPRTTGAAVRLLGATPDGESLILRGLGFSSGAAPFDGTGGTVGQIEPSRLWAEVFRDIGPHDTVHREFELASMSFEAEISASCFAQLKRHRLMTLLSQSYDLDSGVMIPPSIVDAGLENRFMDGWARSLRAARALALDHELLFPYLLSNAHRRRVIIHANARELYHIARLRCDTHAQWEIRSLADQMFEQARALWPRVFALACGKDQFQDYYRREYPNTR